MSLDLAAIFAITENAVRAAVTTSGTIVDVTRTSGGRGSGTVDPVTLALTAEAPETVAAGTGAIVAPLGAGAVQPGYAVDVQVGDMVVVLLVTVEDVKTGDLVTITACRDPRLVGRDLDVLAVLDSSAGAARVLHARPRTGGPS